MKLKSYSQVFPLFERFYPEPIPAPSREIDLKTFFYGEDMGGILFVIHAYELEAHACFNPNMRGSEAVRVGRESIKWVFENSTYNTIFSNITERKAQIFSILCGMKQINNRYEVSRWAD